MSFRTPPLPSFYVHPACSVKTGGFSGRTSIPRDPKHMPGYKYLSDVESGKECKAS